MCFYNDDYDWIASVCDDGEGATDKPARCHECGQRIHVGEPRRHVYMQQYEECRKCCRELREELDDEYEGGDLEPCSASACDYGETFECDICERCNKILTAIRRVEEDEGCSGNETQPAFGELREAMWEGRGEAYLARALADSPELAASGHLDRFYRETNEWDRLYGRDQEQWADEDLDPVEELGGEG